MTRPPAAGARVCTPSPPQVTLNPTPPAGGGLNYRAMIEITVDPHNCEVRGPDRLWQGFCVLHA